MKANGKGSTNKAELVERQLRVQIVLGQHAKQLSNAARVEVNPQELSGRWERDFKHHRAWHDAFDVAEEFWKLLVDELGGAEAKEIMHIVMGDNKSGRPETEYDTAFRRHIYLYLLASGPKSSDETIAKRIRANQPYRAQYRSGLLVVLDNEFSESLIRSADDAIVNRTPIEKTLAAIKQMVRRHRRWAITGNLLPEAHAPKQYYRDSAPASGSRT